MVSFLKNQSPTQHSKISIFIHVHTFSHTHIEIEALLEYATTATFARSLSQGHAKLQSTTLFRSHSSSLKSRELKQGFQCVAPAQAAGSKDILLLFARDLSKASRVIKKSILI